MRKKDKTKFPVARIKKIMQMDEEVGKMAQATPVLISKSLELFMQAIVDDVCRHARACNSRKVTPTHLKRCVESTESYDFLKDIVESVVDDGDGGGAEACIARVAELEKQECLDAASRAEALGGGGGGAPLSMILDALPATMSPDNASCQTSEDGDDDAHDLSYNPAKPAAARGRGRGRGGRGRGRGQARGRSQRGSAAGASSDASSD
ncbi:hypothetical protein GGI04_001659 [Coemansia thaxteri]|uniref:Transcription factor CBF/NF-Y/archaeal histone domain-containing protein n=1 Tax=Coemansia thaxteri TaxID=2663907 RepID=A0A9W8EI29_9FUNG|nr:hypothetical protein H4R26_002900 [Coemansia thaxteri]KAJ2007052.1 hypothetical protein GGI04_001659 [Coemansia thaxteri]KAJ2470081.1 hypothetical protein GGI02_003167 [Coemansia sp. RSA 2322]KAJ2487983.1 hypothetical protein EV174_000220 [Coemansia sp. RSA 2320]